MLLFYLFLYCCLAFEAAGHAYYMTSNECSRPIAVGTFIMFKSAISDDTRQITVKRGNVLLANGATYTPGEKLTVSLSDTGGEYVFELDQGSFENGFCTNSRRYSNAAGTLIAPSSGSGPLTIVAAWAPAKTNVRVVTPFTLVEAGPLTSVAPTVVPTLIPIVSPTMVPTITPSTAPTANPSIQPTVVLTISPSSAATANPSTAPTASPSIQPTVIPTSNPSSAATPSPSSISAAPTLDATAQPPTSPDIPPTAAPTPSLSPTVTPTLGLSTKPTADPSNATSSDPTATSTTIPSCIPTGSPTIPSPSIVPTEPPTAAPSTSSALSPTAAPSPYPTAAPTATPTVTPTVAPTTTPSTASTIAPTTTPTLVPTTARTTTLTLVPTAAPTTTPTLAPTAALSNKPTTSPNSTNRPSTAPSIRPTTTTTTISSTRTPSYTPTRTPTVTTTRRPTNTALTAVTFRADLALSNVSASSITADAQAKDTLAVTMKLTLSHAMATVATPNVVNITTVTSSTVSVIAAQAYLRHVGESKALLFVEPSTRVSYLIAFYLEETAYETPEELHESLDIALNVIMDSQLFLTTLRSFNVSALSNARTASLLSTALESVDVLRSAAPTIAPTTTTNSSDSRAYHTPTSRKATVGVVVGVLSLVGLSLVAYFYATAERTILLHFHRIATCLPILCALFASAAAIGLVSLWATDSPSGDPHYLNQPDWHSNIFAYHPMFMVLFCALQVQAMVGWSIFSAYLTSRRAHILVQVCAALSAVAALVAVVTDMWDTRSPSLVSMHSWVGVAAVAVFGFNFLWGSTMGYLSAFHKHSPLHVRLSLLLSHKYLGVTALVLATMAVLTGVMDFLPRGACDYQLSANTALQKDFDPAENYSYIPGSCKLGNGLGMAVLGATVCAVLTVLLRNVRGEAYSSLLKNSSTIVAPAPPRPSPTLKRQISDSVEWVNFGREELLRQHRKRAAQQLEAATTTAAGGSTKVTAAASSTKVTVTATGTKVLRRGELLPYPDTPSTISTD